MKKQNGIIIRTKYTDKEILENLITVAKKLKQNNLTREQYSNSTFNIVEGHTIQRRFKSWNNALKLAGLVIKKNMNASPKELLENLNELANKLKIKDLSKSDLIPPNSSYSIRPYNDTFGNWTNAKKEWKNYLEKGKIELKLDYSLRRNHSTSKSINKSLELQVKDKFKYRCSEKNCGCGEFAKLNKQKEIKVVHIKKWEDGGETELKNLTVLCIDHFNKLSKKSNVKVINNTRNIPLATIEKVKKRDAHCCVICGRSPYKKGKMYTAHLEVDHKKAFANGGSNHINNLQTLCREHNRKKSKKTI
jgi:5-methylcytosine-specific restriction endonuclease McrA